MSMAMRLPAGIKKGRCRVFSGCGISVLGCRYFPWLSSCVSVKKRRFALSNMLSGRFVPVVACSDSGIHAYVTQAQFYDQQIYETENNFHTF